MDLAWRALDLGEFVERAGEIGSQTLQVAARLDEQWFDRAALLVDQRQQHMRGLDDLVVAAEGERLGVAEPLLESFGEFVLTHGAAPASKPVVMTA
jgi:hypothetical protein